MKLKNGNYYWVKSKHDDSVEIVKYQEEPEGVLHTGLEYLMHIDNYIFLEEIENKDK